MVDSLVAVKDHKLVGHLAISAVTITSGSTVAQALGLGPVAVCPSQQKLGIGKKMITYWLERLARPKDNLIVVLGHPQYYPRFGFMPSKPFEIEWENEVPEEVFMVRELKPAALGKISGIVRYHKAFNQV